MARKRHETLGVKIATAYAGKSKRQLAKLVDQGKLTRLRSPDGRVRYSLAELSKLRRP